MVPADLIRNHRRQMHRSALRWGAGALASLVVLVSMALVIAEVPGLSGLASVGLLLSIAALVFCALAALVRLVASLLPYHPPKAWSGNPDADFEIVMEHARANDRWVRNLQVSLLAAAASIILALALKPLFTLLIWLGMILFAASVVAFIRLLFEHSRAANAVDRLDQENMGLYGAELADQMTVRNRWAPLHWWEWAGEFVLIIAVILGGVMLMDAGVKAGWLPRARGVASGIVSSSAAVLVLVAIFIWSLFRTPRYRSYRPYLVVVTLVAGVASGTVGLIGSLEGWRPFVSQYSGRAAGALLGGTFVAIWLAGYQLTRRIAREES